MYASYSLFGYSHFASGRFLRALVQKLSKLLIPYYFSLSTKTLDIFLGILKNVIAYVLSYCAKTLLVYYQCTLNNINSYSLFLVRILPAYFQKIHLGKRSFSFSFFPLFILSHLHFCSYHSPDNLGVSYLLVSSQRTLKRPFCMYSTFI